MESLAAQLTNAGVECSSPSIFAALGPKPIFRVSTAGGDQAVDAWIKIRSICPETGYWPVMIGSPDDLHRRHFGELPEMAQVEETLLHARSISFPQWFATRHQERLDEFLKYNEGQDPERFSAEIGQWPEDVEPVTTPYTPFNLMSGTPPRQVTFALVPTQRGWEAPAYLGFGGWNECPDPAIQCAVFRYWNDRYGGEIIALTHDVAEATVGRPPTTRSEALALAQEQYEFCEDIVSQGTETIGQLAASLLNGRFWFFWWD